MDFCTSMHMKKSNEWTLTISHCLIVNCTTIWLTAYLLCPGFGEAHVCQGVQGRQVLSVDLGWGWIFSRWQQCGHIAALQWFWLLVCWVNGLGLELTYWGLGVSCVRTSHDYHWVTLCSYVFLFLICEEVSLYPWVEERGESDLRVEQTQVREWERERAVHWSPDPVQSAGQGSRVYSAQNTIFFWDLFESFILSLEFHSYAISSLFMFLKFIELIIRWTCSLALAACSNLYWERKIQIVFSSLRNSCNLAQLLGSATWKQIRQ